MKDFKTRNHFVLYIIFFIFFSCEKCNVYYAKSDNVNSFIGFNCDLYNQDLNSIDNKLYIQVFFKDLILKDQYQDSINAYPILNDIDTLELIEKDNSSFYFKINSNRNIDFIDLKIQLYGKDSSVRKDTCLFFKDLRRTKDCWQRTAFH